MATTRALLTLDHRRDAVARADLGAPGIAEWVDEREPGLRIRVRGKTATWLLKFRAHTVTLGPARRWTPLQAREMASHVRGMLRSGLDPKPWVDARLAGATADEAAGVVLNRHAKLNNEWTIDELMTRYIDGHIKLGRLTRKGRKPPSKNTEDEVNFIKNTKPFSKISNLLVREFNKRLFEEFRNDVAQLHAESTSKKAVTYVRAALTWAIENHAAASGLDEASPWWTTVKSPYVGKTRTREPFVSDLAMTLAIARECRKREGSNRGISGSVIAALSFVIFIVQRRATTEIEWRHVIEDVKSGDGSGILYIPPETMKSRKEHVLPVPARVMEILRPQIEAAKSEGSRWLFPSVRVGRNGDDISIDASALNQMLRRLRAVDSASERRGEVDLLSESGVKITDWSPHDVRRTFGTFSDEVMIRGDAISAVLDHAQGAGSAAAQDAAAITRLAYSNSQRLQLKKLALEPWASKLFEEIAAAEPVAKMVVKKNFWHDEDGE